MIETFPNNGENIFIMPSEKEIEVLKQYTQYYPDWFKKDFDAYSIFVYNLYSKLNFDFVTGGMRIGTEYCSENFSELKYVRFVPYKKEENKFYFLTQDSDKRESILFNIKTDQNNLEGSFLKIKNFLEALKEMN